MLLEAILLVLWVLGWLLAIILYLYAMGKK